MTKILIATAVVLALTALVAYLRAHPDVGLVENWRSWPKMASMRTGVFASAILAFFTAQPQLLVGIFGSLPEQQRIPFAILVFIAGVVLFGVARLTRKEKPDAASATE